MRETTTCAVVGGGPAGMVLGLLLARAGVRVVVLEKHADFLRDFRGDTVHPSTLQVMAELGLTAELDALPHRDARTLRVTTDDGDYTIADFTRLPGDFGYLRFLPQWDLLDLLARSARRCPGFSLRLRAEVLGPVVQGGAVRGVRWRDSDGADHELRADLVVAADGRRSVLRGPAGLVPRRFGAPMDVLWFRLSRRDTDPTQTAGRLGRQELMVRIDRGRFWQCAYLVPKAGMAGARSAEIGSLRASVAALQPFLADRVDALRSWDDVAVLDVQVDRLTRWWRPGLLCIGDAAHAMSPIGGVGVNLAIQDAVAAGRMLAGPLRAGRLTESDLAAVQRRRTLPTVATQTVQLAAQRGFVMPLLRGRLRSSTPLAVRLLDAVPLLQAVPAYAVGIGVRPEHVVQRPRLRRGPRRV